LHSWSSKDPKSVETCFSFVTQQIIFAYIQEE